jgi:DNA-binding transcriptional MerR regulator
LPVVDDPLIQRDEVVALLFNLSDIAEALENSNDFSERTMAKKKLTKAERAEMEARHERMRANTRRTRGLAEKAQAKLDAERSRG